MRLLRALSALAALTAASARAQEGPAPAPAELYKAKCQSCHMADGNSPLELLNFVDGKWTHGSKPQDVARVISEGVPGTAMLPFKDRLTKQQIADLAAYVRSFDKRLKPPKTPRKPN